MANFSTACFLSPYFYRSLSYRFVAVDEFTLSAKIREALTATETAKAQQL